MVKKPSEQKYFQDGTKVPPPILVYEPPPDHKLEKHPKVAEAKYREKEHRKYVDGVGVKDDMGKPEIPGSLYYAVQNGWGKDRDTAKVFQYEARDVNLLVHQSVRNGRGKRLGSKILKGRGNGFSTDGGIFPYYFWELFPGSTVTMTSCDKPRVTDLFNDKVMEALKRMPEHLYVNKDVPTDLKKLFDNHGNRTGDIININRTVNMTYLKLRTRFLNENGIEDYAESELKCAETASSDDAAAALSGKGSIFGFFDEFFLHKRWDMLLRSSKSIFLNASTNDYMGYILAGGVCEEKVTGEELLALQIDWTDTDTVDWEKIFFPASYGKHCINGWSDHARFREYWEKECERLDKKQNKNELIAFQKNYPMTEADIWAFASSNYFEKQTIEVLKAQREVIIANPPPIVGYTLTMLGEEVIKKSNEKGPFWILEPPKEGIFYDATIDSIASGTETGADDGSDAAMIIWKGVDFEDDDTSHMPVAIYLDRPESKEEAETAFINGAIYYDMFGGFKRFSAEGNASTADSFSTRLKKESLSKWITYRTPELTVAGGITKGKPFFYVNDDVKRELKDRANPFIRTYGHRIKFLLLLEDLLKGALTNADLRSAFIMKFTILKLNFDKKAKAAPAPKEEVRPYVIVQGGKSSVILTSQAPNGLSITNHGFHMDKSGQTYYSRSAATRTA